MAVAQGDEVLVGLLADLFPEPARGPVARVDLQQRRVLLLALLARIVAARHERAHVRQIDQVRRQAADRLELLLARRVEPRDRLHQSDRVRMARIGEDLFGRRRFDDVARRT